MEPLPQKQDTFFFNCYKILINMPYYFSNHLDKNMGHGFYNTFSIISKHDSDRKKFTNIFKQMMQKKSFNPQDLNLQDHQISRAIASFLGLGICDALGASTQFIPFKKQRGDYFVKDGFQDIVEKVKNKILDTRAGKVGIWTDDCSMALCLADSVLLKNYKFEPQHIRYMFTMWLQHGLDNGGRPHSIGLGGNIAISMTQFMNKQTDYADQGDKFNNGNGSLMRLAPIPIAYRKNQEQAMNNSQNQSRTTHNGDQAKQCARLLALILCRLINRDKEQNDWKKVIDNASKDFKSETKAVLFLAQSKKQTEQMYQKAQNLYHKKFTKFNKSIDDRDWNWKNQSFTYSQTRMRQQPGYIGSYCMDALSMALHIVWHTKSFKEAAIWSANMGGDCDTVGAIAGQIAGAAYGIDAQMLKLYSEMTDFTSGRYDLFLKAYKLAHKKQLQVFDKIQHQNK